MEVVPIAPEDIADAELSGSAGFMDSFVLLMLPLPIVSWLIPLAVLDIALDGAGLDIEPALCAKAAAEPARPRHRTAAKMVFVIETSIENVCAGSSRPGVYRENRRGGPMPKRHGFDVWTIAPHAPKLPPPRIWSRLMTKSQNRARPSYRPVHPWPLRLMHWLNALAIVMMIGSGLQIYDASPLFDFTFPPLVTIGGWLGAGIAWHLAFIWLLMANGLAYLIWGSVTGHFRQKFFTLSPSSVLREAWAALRFKLPHQKGVYNSVQRLLYTGVIFAGITVVISGLGIWKPVQLWFFTDLCGGYFVARYVHFFAMACIAAFIVIHVLLVILVPKSLPPMITGGKILDPQS